MKYFAVVALIFSVLLVQTVVAQSWKDDHLFQGWKEGIVEEYNHKYARFVTAWRKTLNTLAKLKDNVKTSECVKRATAHLKSVKSAVRTNIDKCLIVKADGKLGGQECAQRAFTKLLSDALKATEC